MADHRSTFAERRAAAAVHEEVAKQSHRDKGSVVEDVSVFRDKRGTDYIVNAKPKQNKYRITGKDFPVDLWFPWYGPEEHSPNEETRHFRERAAGANYDFQGLEIPKELVIPIVDAVLGEFHGSVIEAEFSILAKEWRDLVYVSQEHWKSITDDDERDRLRNDFFKGKTFRSSLYPSSGWGVYGVEIKLNADPGQPSDPGYHGWMSGIPKLRLYIPLRFLIQE